MDNNRLTTLLWRLPTPISFTQWNNYSNNRLKPMRLTFNWYHQVGSIKKYEGARGNDTTMLYCSQLMHHAPVAAETSIVVI